MADRDALVNAPRDAIENNHGPDVRGREQDLQHRAGDPRAAATYRHAIRDAVADDGRLNARRAAGSSRGD